MIARPEAKMWRPSGWGMELRLGTSRLGTGRLRPGFGGGVVVSAVGNVPFERQSWTSAKLVELVAEWATTRTIKEGRWLVAAPSHGTTAWPGFLCGARAYNSQGVLVLSVG